jgi:sulfur relay (sulfurtransferase) DsrC/TusE family protein
MMDRQAADRIRQDWQQDLRDMRAGTYRAPCLPMAYSEKLPLTAMQFKVLTFIKDYTSHHGVAPVYREFQEAFGIKSQSRIHCLLHDLEDKGYIRIEPEKVRGIEVLP